MDELDEDHPSPPGRSVAFRWQVLKPEDAPSSVCYDLSDASGTAYVFVLRKGIADVQDSSPPRQPTHSTRGWCIGVWQSDAQIYVVMVRGSRQRYQELVGRPSNVV